MQTEYRTSKTEIFAERYLDNFKKFLNSIICTLNIEYPEEIKGHAIKNLVYSGKTDVLYIYIDDDFTSNLMTKTLKNILSKDIEPCLNSITTDRINNINVIELNYMQNSIIDTNINQKIDTLTI